MSNTELTIEALRTKVQAMVNYGTEILQLCNELDKGKLKKMSLGTLEGSKYADRRLLKIQSKQHEKANSDLIQPIKGGLSTGKRQVNKRGK